MNQAVLAARRWRPVYALDLGPLPSWRAYGLSLAEMRAYFDAHPEMRSRYAAAEFRVRPVPPWPTCFDFAERRRECLADPFDPRTYE